MASSVSNVISGPATVTLTSTDIGHTQGGVQVKVTPKNRMRVVDKFGQGELAVIHQGDVVRCTCPFAEYAAETLAAIYNPGYDNTAAAMGAKYLGIGRTAGYIYTTQDMKITPRLSADALKLIEFFKATPVGEFEQMFDDKADRIFKVDFACLTDESQTQDGALIGTIGLA